MTVQIDVKLFAANLNRIMTVQGIRNARLSESVAASREAVGNWRRGVNLPSDIYIGRLCKVLRCTPQDLTRPLFAANISGLMAAGGISVIDLAKLVRTKPVVVRRWLQGKERPSDDHLAALTKVLECSKRDIIGIPNVMPITRWATREGIPVSRARRMFDLDMLDGAVQTKFEIMVPKATTAPSNSKRMVSLANHRPKWGITGLDKFSRRLTRAMRRSGVTNIALAEATKVNPTTVSHWKKGQRTPEEDKLPFIARCCNVEVADLLGQ